MQQIFSALNISLANGRGMFIAVRAALGIGVQGTLVIAPSLLQEIAHPRYRVLCEWQTLSLTPSTKRLQANTPLLSDMGIYYFAAIISACVCRGTFSLQGNQAWRIPCFIQIVGPAMVLLFTFTCPESPRVRTIQ